MLKVLFLDDELWRVELYRRAFPKHNVTWRRDPKDFVEAARKERFDLISMDYNQHSSRYLPTGIRAAVGLCEGLGESKHARIIVHSSSVVGAVKMRDLFEEAQINSSRERFGEAYYFELVRRIEEEKRSTGFFKRLLRRLFRG